MITGSCGVDVPVGRNLGITFDPHLVVLPEVLYCRPLASEPIELESKRPILEIKRCSCCSPITERNRT